MQIIEVDLQDESARREFFAVEQEVIRHDQVDGWERSYESFARWANQGPNPYRRPIGYAALVDGRWAGTAEVGLPLQDNTHSADVEVAVRPEFRRTGVGSALLGRLEQVCAEHRRTTLFGELTLPHTADADASPGGLFAKRFGFECVHQEDHLVLDLPADTDHLDDLAQPARDAYEIIVWGDHCPEEHVAAYCTMRTRMSADVPVGDLAIEPVAYDEARLRTTETRTAQGWLTVVAAARRRTDGVMGGYSMLRLPRGGELAMQDDTLVMPEHRGHRVGTALKLATLDVLRAEHPERRALHTWTEPGNHAMQRTNADFGYTPRNRMREMQRVE